MIDRADFAVHADGNVILEFQELSGMGRKDRNKVKQWITLDADEFRKPYDPLPTKFPRKFVLAGTTNESQYLNDPTGDRRFWPVTVGMIDIKALKNDTEQLWAEAVHRHKAGEKHYIEPTDPVYGVMQQEQAIRYTGDAWEGVIVDYLQHTYKTTPDEIFTEVLRIDRQHWDNRSRGRITDILIKAGYRTKSVRDDMTGKVMRKWVLDEPKKAVVEADNDLNDEEVEF